MKVSKDDVKKKLLKDFNIEKRYICGICRQVITLSDIENLNFEYCKNKRQRKFCTFKLHKDQCKMIEIFKKKQKFKLIMVYAEIIDCSKFYIIHNFKTNKKKNN